jgi:ABC-type transport system involved in multi-copper enzyme maturation permease subunit
MPAVAKVVLKQHRIELGIATLLALAVAVGAALLAALEMEGSPYAEQLLRIMGWLPFGLGLLVGVPIVSRELESRTAQLAWSLDGSRVRWLGRQAMAILPILLIAAALAGFGTSTLVGRFEDFAEPAFFMIGTYGVPAVARVLAGFGLGLAFGSLVGRGLPAFVLGAIAAMLLASLVTSARGAWLETQGPLLPMDGATQVIQTEPAMLAPDGTLLTLDAAITRVPAGVAEPEVWLEENGYSWSGFGVAKEVAMGWASYDAAIFVLVGLVTAGCAVWLVNERRPT